MLRASILRASPAVRPLARQTRPQWRVVQRCYADNKNLGETAVPNPAPTVTPSSTEKATIPSSDIPKPPPAPETAGASRSAPTIQPATTPPTGPGSASIAPDPKQPKPKKKGRIRRLLFWLTILSGLGYAGGVWYSLVSDNFHDFFTEYVPYGEDAVAYFEEREFRKRFPGRAGQPRLQPQISGENKVTIPGRSGLSARVADEGHSDLGTKGPHTSAVADNKPKTAGGQPKVASNTPAATPPEKNVQEKKQEAAQTATVVKEEAAAPALAKPVNHLDHLAVPDANDAVVQDVVKIVNDIITVINADSAHDGKYNSALDKAKSELGRVVSDINLMKANLRKESEEKVKSAHDEFEQAAKELVQRLDHQMQAQEAHWKEEFENERERLSQTYKDRLRSELEAAEKVYEQKTKNELLQQSIHLQKSFTASVRERVEAERDGRLGKLNELSSSVHELEKLTAEWNSVVDANLKTQHLVVAVEAVKSALETQATPKPFVTELAALKEIAADDPVVSAAIASINPAAYQRGIPSPALLIDRFRRVAAEVRKAALLPEDAGVASHIASLAMSKVLFKKSGLAVGQDVEAVLARTEVLLEEGDLDAAAREMNGLQGWAKVLSKDWLGECRRVLEVRQALDVIATEARLNSLLVD
ncbi:MICOS complex subunit MIC60 [Parastagonospora nodorum]|nr:MICOS complex subunit MIC60 [Parastagonospora nodorum]KAH4994877.1 MICOS complex subunit MIC60 [Parastagonospora nodorum]KAH5205836.1 MICOS complex subunit MIC60 [Parastagonospora nodorum]KAH5236750.1 MICOS complex subunit MIC60 [Parastagonospora nodorum]KAH5371595.1 MICOS complex subunit MIC60 [Parastagonospora nodorum]